MQIQAGGLARHMPDTEKTEKTAAPVARKAAAVEAPVPAEPEPPTDAAIDSEEYERLLDMYDVSFKNFAEGEAVKGIVLQLTESEVVPGARYKSQRIIPIDEFLAQ